MNVSANRQTLIIGIGNPLRSDDGLGWAVAQMLSQDQEFDCVVRTVHQLTPELAQWMAQVSSPYYRDECGNAARQEVPGMEFARFHRASPAHTTGAATRSGLPDRQ